MSLVRRGGIAVVLIAVLLFAVAVIIEGRYDREVAAAVAFCDALVPHLEAYREEKGVYPAKIEPSWYGGSAPDLIQVSDFYVVQDDGAAYLLRVRDPRVDPRFWFNDVYGYSSRTGRWQQYDGY
jgi:hypothetical protein